jgi:hypothetical protein
MEAGSTGTMAAHATVAPECVICGTALAGPFGALFRLVGISRSARNPNLCNRCNTHVEEGRVVGLTVLFAVVALACLTFLFIVFELVAHAYLH